MVPIDVHVHLTTTETLENDEKAELTSFREKHLEARREAHHELTAIGASNKRKSHS